jgi:hypothetical protein
MPKVTWERTVIAGKTGHEDFLARDETGRSVGRIYRQIGGHNAGECFWCFNTFGPDINWPRYPAVGTEPTKQGAADRVRRVYAMCLRI